MKGAAVGLAVLVATLVARPAHARECADVQMPDAITVDDTTMLLNGVGVRRETIFNIDVYVVALYLEHRTNNASIALTSEQKKQLRLHFLRGVSRETVVKAIRQDMEHAPGAPYLTREIRQLESLLPPHFQAGQEIAFTYRPGVGVTVYRGNQATGTIAGALFAQTFLGIWLGNHPPSQGIKSALLNGPCND